MFTEPLKSLFIQNKPFTTEDAAKLLSLSTNEVSKILYRYKNQGHLYMLKRGIYIPVAHKGLAPDEAFTDPWIIVPTMFANSYIGGWSAANFFGLTEQLFQVTCLITKQKIHHKTVKIGKFEYNLFSDALSEDIGIDSTWRENIQVPISNVHRTVVDMLEDPACGGGIQHAIDCLKVYFAEKYDEKIFISCIEKVKNGAFFKRLGYIVETLLDKDHVLCTIAKQRISKGCSALDPALKCDKLITRWRLYINKDIVI